jgi:hypothetical protein
MFLIPILTRTFFVPQVQHQPQYPMRLLIYTQDDWLPTQGLSLCDSLTSDPPAKTDSQGTPA